MLIGTYMCKNDSDKVTHIFPPGKLLYKWGDPELAYIDYVNSPCFVYTLKCSMYSGNMYIEVIYVHDKQFSR